MFDNLRNTWNLDEEVFENRNRDYGAYQLRRKYNSVVTASILIAVLIFTGTILLPFLMQPREQKVLTGSGFGIPVQMEHFEIPEDVYLPPAAPPPPPKAQEVMKYVPPVVVDSVVPVSSMLPTPEELSDLPQDDLSELTGTGTGNNDIGVEGGISTDQPYFFVETMPSFKGGDINKFRDWVLKRTNYPQEAIDKKIRGQVLLTFIVETDGSVSTVNVVRGVNPLIDNEAVKAIQASPKWTPGYQHGQPVRVRYSIPINFTF